MDKLVKEVIHTGKLIPEFKDCIITKPKLKRIYEDEDFIIDLVTNDLGHPMLRVSIFDDKGHFLDEEFIRKTDYLG